MPLISQLFDSRFNGADLLWIVFAVGMVVAMLYARVQVEGRAERAAELLDQYEPGVLEAVEFEWKAPAEVGAPAAVAERQARLYGRFVAEVYGIDPSDVEVVVLGG